MELEFTVKSMVTPKMKMEVPSEGIWVTYDDFNPVEERVTNLENQVAGLTKAIESGAAMEDIVQVAVAMNEKLVQMLEEIRDIKYRQFNRTASVSYTGDTPSADVYVPGSSSMGDAAGYHLGYDVVTAKRLAYENKRPLLMTVCYDGCGACDKWHTEIAGTDEFKAFLEEHRIYYATTQTTAQAARMAAPWGLSGGMPYIVMFAVVAQPTGDYKVGTGQGSSNYVSAANRANIVLPDEATWLYCGSDQSGEKCFTHSPLVGTYFGVQMTYNEVVTETRSQTIHVLVPSEWINLFKHWFPNTYFDEQYEYRTGTDGLPEKQTDESLSVLPSSTESVNVRIRVINAEINRTYYANAADDTSVAYYPTMQKTYIYDDGELTESMTGYILVHVNRGDAISVCRIDDSGVANCVVKIVDTVTNGWAFFEYDASTQRLYPLNYTDMEELAEQQAAAQSAEENKTFGYLGLNDLYFGKDGEELKKAKKAAYENNRPMLVFFCQDICSKCHSYEDGFLSSSSFKKFLVDYQIVFFDGWHSSGDLAKMFDVFSADCPSGIPNRSLPQMAMIQLTDAVDLNSGTFKGSEFDVIKTETISPNKGKYAWWYPYTGVSVAYGVELQDGGRRAGVDTVAQQLAVYKAWFPNNFYEEDGRAKYGVTATGGAEPTPLTEEHETVYVTFFFNNMKSYYAPYVTMANDESVKLFATTMDNYAERLVVQTKVGEYFTICRYDSRVEDTEMDSAISCVVGRVEGRSPAGTAIVSYDCETQEFVYMAGTSIPVHLNIVFRKPQSEYEYYATLDDNVNEKLYPTTVDGVLKLSVDTMIGSVFTICRKKGDNPATCIAGIAEGMNAQGEARIEYDCVEQLYTYSVT